MSVCYIRRSTLYKYFELVLLFVGSGGGAANTLCQAFTRLIAVLSQASIMTRWRGTVAVSFVRYTLLGFY